MNKFIESFIDAGTQCWGCGVFDVLFYTVSKAATALYEKLSFLCLILFCIMFAFFVLNAVWENLKSKKIDAKFEKSIKPVFITALVAVALLGAGVSVPRFITRVTFEPTADIVLAYTQSMLNQTQSDVDERVQYSDLLEIPSDEIFRPQLRDTIIKIIQTTITQFQSYIKVGIIVMDSALEWQALFSIGEFLKHIIIFFMGVFLVIGFFKLFLRFCFYFADVIIAMVFFAFFFPLSLATVSFSNAEHVPSWMSGLGKSLGTGQIKKLIGAIISLASAVITYTIIMSIIARFLASANMDPTELTHAITAGELTRGDFDMNNFASMGVASISALLYLLLYIYAQIPQVTKMILSAFNVEENAKLNETAADNAMTLGKDVLDNVLKPVGKQIISGGTAVTEKQKSDTKTAEAKK